MELPLWGSLQKSVDDSETIEQAIARLISEHEEAPTSHLGAGESLALHKAEDIIDHPPGSVLADKATMTEFAVRTYFNSLDGWTVSGEVNIINAPGLQIYIEDGVTESSRIYTNPQIPINFLNSSKDMVFQILGRFDLSNSSYNTSFGFFTASGATPQGFGFVKDGSSLYGHARQGTNQNRTSAISVDLSIDHVYRAFLDATLQEISFYVDGDLVGTVDVPGTGWEDDTGPSIWLTDTGGNDGNLFLAELFFSRQI